MHMTAASQRQINGLRDTLPAPPRHPKLPGKPHQVPLPYRLPAPHSPAPTLRPKHCPPGPTKYHRSHILPACPRPVCPRPAWPYTHPMKNASLVAAGHVTT